MLQKNWMSYFINAVILIGSANALTDFEIKPLVNISYFLIYFIALTNFFYGIVEDAPAGFSDRRRILYFTITLLIIANGWFFTSIVFLIGWFVLEGAVLFHKESKIITKEKEKEK